MRKILLIAFFMVLSVLIISCLPPTGESGEKTALAGLAISKGCYDADNDGYGRSGRAISSCPGSSKLFDCNDNNPAVHPGAMEACGDRVDNNCNKRVDEAGCFTCTDTDPTDDSAVRGTATGLDFYGNYVLNQSDSCAEADSGVLSESGPFLDQSQCLPDQRAAHGDYYLPCPSGQLCQNGVCATVPACVPTAEICDGVDNDCDGIIDYSSGETVCQMNCSDTNPEGSGYVTVTAYMFNGSIIPSQTHTRSDFCADDDYLIYFYCEPRSNYPGMEITGRVIRCSSTNPSFVCVDPDGRPPSAAAGNYSSNLPAYCGLSVNSTLVCGNGILESGEICDDGNTIDGDSCSQCTCLDSDVSSSNPYTVRGNVTSMDASGGVVINYDYCDPEGTDLFEYACDGNRVYATDYSCTALGSEYRCIDRSNDLGYPRGYSGYCG